MKLYNYKLWYVNKDATGNGSGTSWTNASTTISGLPWTSINGGDTIYISGGTTTKTYTSTLSPKKSGSLARRIIITAGKDTGHNGIPFFNISGDNSALYINGYNYIEISYIKFRNQSTNNTRVCNIANAIGIDFLHNTIIHPSAPGIAFEKASGSIQYDSIYTGIVNTTGETDGIDLSTSGHIEIGWCYVSSNNANTSPHVDLIQAYAGFGASGQNLIHDNFFYGQTSSSSEAMLNLEGIQGHWEVYNNIVSQANVTSFTFGIYLGNNQNANDAIYAYVFNNTLSLAGNAYPLKITNGDSTVFKNNLIYKPSGSVAVQLAGSTYSNYCDIDYNHYYLNSGTSNQGRIGESNYYNWSQWQGLGFEIHGSTGSFSFTNKSGSNITDYIPNIYKNGVSLSNYFTTDILGKTRSGTWEMGALEK